MFHPSLKWLVLLIQKKQCGFRMIKKIQSFAEVWPFHPDLCEERHGSGHQEKENHLKTVPSWDLREGKNETTAGWFT